MIKKVTVFKNNGDVEVHEVNFIFEAAEKMEPGEYAHPGNKFRWMKKIKHRQDGLERIQETYEYVHESVVPEELRIKLVLIQ